MGLTETCYNSYPQQMQQFGLNYNLIFKGLADVSG